MSRLIGALLIASLLMVAMACAALVLLRADRRNRLATERLARIAAPHLPADTPLLISARLTSVLPTSTLRWRAKTLIGMDPHREDPYPLRPFLVLPLALLPGYAVQWLMHGLLGSLAWWLCPVAAIGVTRAIYRGNDAKRTQTLYRQFPDALAMIVRAVRVGIPVTEALRNVAQDAPTPTSIEFGRLHDQVGVGTPLEDGLRELAARNRLPEYRFFATALALQSQTGGGLTENAGEPCRRCPQADRPAVPRLCPSLGGADERRRAHRAADIHRPRAGRTQPGLRRDPIRTRERSDPAGRDGHMALASASSPCAS